MFSKFKKVALAGAMLVAPLAAVGIAETAVPVAAHASNLAQCQAGWQTAIDQFVDPYAVDDAYTYLPLTDTYPVDDPFNWQYMTFCWHVTHVAPNADQGYLFFGARGSSNWVGSAYPTNSGALTQTANGPGPHEEFAFQCEGNGNFAINDVANGYDVGTINTGPATWLAATPTTGYKTLSNFAAHGFCS